MPVKFGTSGLRGLSSDLLSNSSKIYTLAFASHLISSGYAKRNDRVFVGRDLRESSPQIAEICMKALAAGGLVPVDCGILPTPALAFFARSMGAAALMVTGSHIPADRNGIKFYRPDGEIDKNDEAAISALADAPAPAGPAMEVGPSRSREALDLFMSRYRDLLPARALEGLRIGVYEHSTVARDLLGELLAGFGAEIVRLGRSDTFVPVDTEAVSAQTSRLLRDWASKHALDAIVSADGDGDRPLIADEHGDCLRGDVVGLLTASFLGADVVVTPITSNSGICDALGFEVIRTRVGSPHVIEGMADPVRAGGRTVLGFEANGGVLLGTAFAVGGTTLAALPTRDCFTPILSVLAKAAASGVPLSRMAQSWNLPVCGSDRIENFAPEASRRLLIALRDDSSDRSRFFETIGTVRSVDDTDGLRMVLEGGDVVHLRASGNAPELRCYVEAVTGERADHLLKASIRRVADFVATHTGKF